MNWNKKVWGAGCIAAMAMVLVGCGGDVRGGEPAASEDQSSGDQADGSKSGRGFAGVTGEGDGDGDGDWGGSPDGYAGGGVSIGGGAGIGYGAPGGGLSGGAVGDRLDALDPAGCNLESNYQEQQWCDTFLSCENGEWVSAYCDGYDGGCYCDRAGMSLRLDGVDSCDAAVQVCLGAIEVTGEETCSPSFRENYDQYCGLGRECLTPVSAGDTTTSLSTYEDTWCDFYDGDWHCQCSAGPFWGEVDFDGELGSPGVCETALDVCTDAPWIDPSLPSRCEPRSQYGYQDFCEFELSCSQERVFDGVPATVTAHSWGGCEQTGSGAWDCHCGQAGSGFEQSVETAWEACSAASVQCAL